jgi:hypothetical protein
MGVEPDAVRAVVAPMILQFFVLALYWFGGVPLGAYRVLLPFLMVSTGLLFFSDPLAPLWTVVLGDGFEGFPSAMARVGVLGMNLAVAALLVGWTGGLRRSPYAVLLFGTPLLAGLVGGGGTGPAALGGGGIAPVVGLGILGVFPALLLAVGAERGRFPLPGARVAPATPPNRWILRIGVGLLLVLAGWLGGVGR